MSQSLRKPTQHGLGYSFIASSDAGSRTSFPFVFSVGPLYFHVHIGSISKFCTNACWDFDRDCIEFTSELGVICHHNAIGSSSANRDCEQGPSHCLLWPPLLPLSHLWESLAFKSHTSFATFVPMYFVLLDSIKNGIFKIPF